MKNTISRYYTNSIFAQLLKAIQFYSQQFYCKRLYSIVNNHQRKELESYFIIISKHLLLIFIILDRDLIENLVKIDYKIQFLAEYIVENLHSNDVALQFTYFALSLNILLFSYLAFQFVHYIIFEKQKHKTQFQQGINSTNIDGIRRIPTKKLEQNILERLFSIVFKWYNQLLLYPFLYYASIKMESFNIFNIIITVLVGKNYQTLYSQQYLIIKSIIIHRLSYIIQQFYQLKRLSFALLNNVQVLYVFNKLLQQIIILDITLPQCNIKTDVFIIFFLKESIQLIQRNQYLFLFILLIFILKIGYLVNNLDYEFLIYSDEFYSKKYDYLSNIIYLYECMTLSLFHSSSVKLKIILFCLLVLVQIIFQIFRQPLNNINLQQLFLFFNILYFISSLIIIIFQNLITQTFSIQIWLLLCLPISYKLSILIIDFSKNTLINFAESSNIIDILLLKYRNRKIELETVNKSNVFDRMLRFLIFNQEDLNQKNNIKNILLLNFSTSWCQLRKIIKEEEESEGYFKEQQNSQVSIQYSESNKKSQFHNSFYSSRKYNTDRSDRSAVIRKNSSLYRDNLSEGKIDTQSDILLFQILLDYFSVIIEGKTELSNSHINMLVFILQVVKNYQLFWIKLNQFNKLKSSLKDLQIINTLEAECQKQVRIQLKKNQDHSMFYQGLLDVIYFDNLLNQTSTLIHKAINSKVNILEKMKCRNVNLIDLYEIVSDFLSLRSQILKNIKIAYRINPESKELDQISLDYNFTISFSSYDLSKSRLSDNMQEDYTQIQSILQDKYTNYFDQNHDKFSSNTCVIYVSLKNEQKFQINQVSSNFFKMFNYQKKEEIQNHSVEMLLPPIIANFHNLFIKDFFEKPTDKLNEYYIQNKQPNDQTQDDSSKINYANSCIQVSKNKERKTLFAVTSDRHLIAVKLDVKINKIEMNNELGLTAQIQQVNKYNDYILFRTETCQIISTTFKIHRKIFKAYNHFHEIKLKKYFSFLRNKAEYNILQSFENNQKSNEEQEVLTLEEQIKQLELLQEKQKQLFKVEFDYFLVVKNEKKNKKMQAKKLSTNENQTQQASLYNKYSFFKLTLCLKDFEINHSSFTKYQLSYLEITSMKRINPQCNQKILLDFITCSDSSYKTNINSLSQKNLQVLYQDLEEAFYRTVKQEDQNKFQNNKQITYLFSLTQSIQGNQFHSDQNDSNSNHSQDNQYINHNKATSAAETENQDSQFYSQSAFKQRLGQNVFKFDTNNNDSMSQKWIKENQLNGEDINILDLSQQQQLQQSSIRQNSNYKYDQNLDNTSKLNKNNLEDILEEDINSSPEQNKNLKHKKNQQLALRQIIDHEDVICNYPAINDITKSSKLQQNEQSFRSDIQHLDFDQSHYQNVSTYHLPIRIPSSQQIGSSKNITQDIISPKIFSDHQLGSSDNLQQSFFSNIRQQKIQILKQLPLNTVGSALLSKNTLKEQSTEFTKKVTNGKHNPMNNNQELHDEMQDISDIDEEENDNKRKTYKIYSDEVTRQNERREGIETSSAASKVSSIEQVKKQFRKTILTKKSHYSLYFVNIFGLISIIIIFIVNFQQFFATKETLQSVKEDFQIAQWPLDYNNQMYGLIEAFNLNRLSKYNTNLVYQTDDRSIMKQIIAAFIDDCFGSIKKLVRDLMAYDIDRTIVSIIFQEPFQLNLTIPISFRHSTDVNDDSEEIVNCKLGYCMILMQQYAFRYSHFNINEDQTSYSEQIFLQNQRPISIMLKSLFVRSIDFSRGSLDSIKVSLENLVIIITVISGFCVSLVIPLYSFIQTYREKILSLLTTFSIEAIDEIISNIQQYLTSNLDRQTSYKTQQNDLKQKQAEYKKQNLSYFSKLPKFNKKLIFSSLLILLLIFLYPILNRELTLSYISESQQNLQILLEKLQIYKFMKFSIKNTLNLQFIFIIYQKDVISRIKSYILLNSGLQYSGLTVKQIASEERVLSLQEILNRIQASLEDQEQIQQDLIDVMEGTYLKNRHKQQEFDGFFVEMMMGNPCEVIKKYPEFILPDDVIDEDKCKRQQKKLLKNGLLIAVKSFMSHFKDVYSELKDVPSDKLEKLYIIDYDEQINVLINLLDNLSSFIKMKNEEYYEYIVDCQIYLMIYQFFTLTAIFYLSWILFYRFIDRQLHATKLSLSFLHIINLVSNPYIQSYFQQRKIS